MERKSVRMHFQKLPYNSFSFFEPSPLRSARGSPATSATCLATPCSNAMLKRYITMNMPRQAQRRVVRPKATEVAIFWKSRKNLAPVARPRAPTTRPARATRNIFKAEARQPAPGARTSSRPASTNTATSNACHAHAGPARKRDQPSAQMETSTSISSHAKNSTCTTSQTMSTSLGADASWPAKARLTSASTSTAQKTALTSARAAQRALKAGLRATCLTQGSTSPALFLTSSELPDLSAFGCSACCKGPAGAEPSTASSPAAPATPAPASSASGNM
mmetsp:Transcript_30557/g.101646  ORF Transcript_30557/g.101646 Transcript_30557/m.101646 type:complete len:277 (-) Transcript_30557:1344-2174(-)